ncbi:phosphatidylserine decarboxylase-domain-containing protein [Gilbertella persicaria]|uniref:phosphatidylserine decarboxylase-domain-containing protein n=1 Tax=Gilbertella persicaria TaxID=101096 RepID=UPI0022207A22|nr:phosphatidylserine decarboxylase-domain-containing protein [Gilbertella persicaria]KAI8091016.1 phosphatidylserine decarboxylase-domain-containing protein [Gilbertella persicaria]
MTTEDYPIDENAPAQPFEPEIERQIENNDQAGLMRSFTFLVDKSTQSDAAAAVVKDGIHAPSSKIPKHWHRRKLTSWLHKHLVPESLRSAIEKKYGNFIIIRSTGELHYEEMPIYTRIGMHLIFGGYHRDKVASSEIMQSLFLKETLRQGQFFSEPESVEQIPSFINHYSIDMTNYVISDIQEYKNFNEFFSRAILPEKRPIAEPEDEGVIVSSADSRLNVFDSVDAATTFWIKGKEFTLAKLLQDEALAQELEGGSLAIFRLAPQDYHRFHVPARGTIESMKNIEGAYYTVNPCTINTDLDVFTENHRNVATLKSPLGFNYAFVSIGALLVGSIVMTNGQVGKELAKGEEMGYFQYGGSTCIAVFPKDAVTWDEDLRKNSENSLETLVTMGDRIGVFNV